MKKRFRPICAVVLIFSLVFNNLAFAEDIGLSLGFPNTSEAGLEDLDVAINILYDNMYYENVLLGGKELALEIIAHNKSSDLKMIQFFVGMYDADGNMVDVGMKEATIAAGDTQTIILSEVIPQDPEVEKAIVYIWDNRAGTKPYIAFTMTPTWEDYYGNSFADATKIKDISKFINGTISSSFDEEYINFTAPTSGDYTFQCFGTDKGMDFGSYLFNANNVSLTYNTGMDGYMFTKTLEAGKTYCLRTFAENPGDYVISIQPNTEIQNFDIYAYDVEISRYKSAIKALCETALDSGDQALSQEIYNKYELAFDTDLRLHELPIMLKDMAEGNVDHIDFEDYEKKVKAYFSAKKTEFEALKQTYLSILTEYSNEPVMAMNESSPQAADSNETPLIGAKAPLMVASDEGGASDRNAIQVTATAEATPSLTVSPTSTTSVKVNVTFPTSGKKGNALSLIDFNQGGTIEQIPYDNNIYQTNGSIPISGLTPGGYYVIGMHWPNDDGTYGGERTIYRKVQLPDDRPENLTSTESTHLRATLEANDKALASTADFNTWLNNMDQTYSKLQDLTGYTPYNGRKIELKSTRQDLLNYPGFEDGKNYWIITCGYAGNPVQMSRPFYRSHMLRLPAGDWGYIPMHEISHDFDLENDDWCFDTEAIADLKLCYVLDALPGSKVYGVGSKKYYTGSTINNYFKSDSFCGYDYTFGKGSYSYWGMVSVMLGIKEKIGWAPFKQTFRDMSDLSLDEMNYIYATPRMDEIGKFNIFLTKLRDSSRKDVISMLSDTEKNIIARQYGGKIEYYAGTNATGGGGQSNVHMPAGRSALRRFTPTETASYKIFTTSYAGSGAPCATELKVYSDEYLNNEITSATSNGFSSVTVSMQANQTYFIKISHPQGAILHTDLKISKASIPLNGQKPNADIQVSAMQTAILNVELGAGSYIFQGKPYGGVTQTTGMDGIIEVYGDEALTKRIARSTFEKGKFPGMRVDIPNNGKYFITFTGYLNRAARAQIGFSGYGTLTYSQGGNRLLYSNAPEAISSESKTKATIKAGLVANTPTEAHFYHFNYDQNATRRASVIVKNTSASKQTVTVHKMQAAPSNFKLQIGDADMLMNYMNDNRNQQYTLSPNEVKNLCSTQGRYAGIAGRVKFTASSSDVKCTIAYSVPTDSDAQVFNAPYVVIPPNDPVFSQLFSGILTKSTRATSVPAGRQLLKICAYPGVGVGINEYETVAAGSYLPNTKNQLDGNYGVTYAFNNVKGRKIKITPNYTSPGAINAQYLFSWDGSTWYRSPRLLKVPGKNYGDAWEFTATGNTFYFILPGGNMGSIDMELLN